MFKVNEYFDGTVKSIAFDNAEGQATIGVMAPGNYDFGTSQREIMHVVSGALTIQLPDSTEWETFNAGRTVQRSGQQQVQGESRRHHRLPVRIPRLTPGFTAAKKCPCQGLGHFY
jgi:uncharacterized protein YaiE (UPF0345 family)